MTVAKSVILIPAFESGGVVVYQTVRGTNDFGGKPWHSNALYPGLGGMEFGEVRLFLRLVGCVKRDCVVVRCLELAATEPGCVLTQCGCTRLAWAFERAESEWPNLALVECERPVGLEQVHTYFKDVDLRHGVGMMPSKVPQTSAVRHSALFFSNKFYLWTSRSLRPGL